MSFKPIDSRNDEFRKYIEEAGVIELLTNLLIKLVEEKNRPNDPLQFIRGYLGCQMQEDNEQIDQLKLEVDKYRGQVEDLKNQLAEVTSQPKEIIHEAMTTTVDNQELVADTTVSNEVEVVVEVAEADAVKVNADVEPITITDVRISKVVEPVKNEIKPEPVKVDEKPIVESTEQVDVKKVVTTEIKPEQVVVTAANEISVTSTSDTAAAVVSSVTGAETIAT